MIDKLEYLIALSREKHFGRAAEVCGVTQPTFSAGIKQLEDILGVMLVRRGSRFLGLTTEGERTLEWARRIVSDTRALRQDIDALKRGLTGHLRIAVIPTALPAVPALTQPFCSEHPSVKITILSKSSIEILGLLENLEIDAGLTYLDNEPLGRVKTIPLYREKYVLLTTAAGPLQERQTIGWAEAGLMPLCLLTPDMQNRRIIDSHMREADVKPDAMLESNSVIALFAHVQSGRWSSILAEKLAASFASAPGLRAIPLVKPEASHMIGLIAPQREPMTPLIVALLAVARRTVNDKVFQGLQN